MLTWITCAVAALLAVQPGHDGTAETIDLLPPVLEIAADRYFEDLTIRNASVAPVLVRTATHRWSQDAGGTMFLEAAEDLSAFPAELRIDPGAVRRVRIYIRPSFRTSPRAGERAYRLALDVTSEGAAHAKRVLVPVFVAPSQPVERAGLELVCDGKRHCRIAVLNEGNVRVLAAEITLRVQPPSSGERQERLAPAWILAGDLRTFPVEVPELGDGARVSVRAVIGGRSIVADAVPSRTLVRLESSMP